MKKLVRALCAALLVIGICSSSAALAETPYYIDASLPAPSPNKLLAPEYHLATLGDSRVAFQLRYQVVDGNAVITGYQASGGAAINDLIIPAQVDGYPVTAIGDSAFEECWRVLDWVVLPDGVISIGESAFRGCVK